MDPLTHTATGVFLSRAGLNRLTPQATPILILAANAPDIDIVTAAGGSLNYLHYHRHLTHALVAMPVLAFLCVALVRAAGRRPVQWTGAFVAALAAVASHLLLDFTNVYGIRLLLPFSEAWLRLDWTPVIDLFIWAALLLGFAGPFLSRLVTSEITSGKPRAQNHGRRFAWFALSFLFIYNCGRGVLHARAVETLDARVYDGAVPTRVAAGPEANPLLWRGLVETAEFYAVEDINLAGRFDPGSGQVFHKASSEPALDRARNTDPFRIFLGFSQFPLWEVIPATQPADSEDVRLLDLRFGTPSEPGFMVSAVVDNRGQVLQTGFQFGPPRPR
ncbi:MAG: metal-dependent hydrolase [Acidobacteriia bacterium]|nr:metal-dependent hydrolase [Terriglobia bacterium]